MSAAAGPAISGDRPRGVSSRLRRACACLLVMVVAAFLLFVRLGEVRAPIWDEAYYLPSTARFHEGHLQFATHPPLGLMLIAAGDALYGANCDIDQRPIAAVKSISGEAMPAGYDYLGPRLAPAVFGVIGAGLFFLLMAELTRSTGAALMLSPLWLCDTAMLAQARAAHLDPFELTFVLAAMLSLGRALAQPRRRWCALFGMAVMAASLVRANAVMLAPLALFVVWPLVRERQWTGAVASVTAFVAGALLTFVAVVAAYALASPDLPDSSTSAGQKDWSYVTPAIARAGRVDAGDPRVLVALVGDYARYMASDNRDMARHDANASHPWQWLVGSGAVTYRWDAGGSRVATIALLPNLASWVISLAGVLATLWAARRGLSSLRLALLAGWLLNMAVLIWLDQGRVLYLYAYFLPLLLGHALAALVWREHGLNEGAARLALAAVTLSFLAAAPLAFHHEVPKTYCAVFLRQCGAGDATPAT